MESPLQIIGIDEAGRGPLAGPVYVGLVQASVDFNFGIFPNLDDSKKITERRREIIFNQLENLKHEDLTYTTSHSSASTIDQKGINPAIQQALNRGLRRLNASSQNTHIYLDGGLKAPNKFEQTTIIGGDQKKSIISLASVIAKVKRDRKMKKEGGKHTNYNFSQHKGYGTKKHRKAIAEHGLSPLHRKSFCGGCI